jgi:transcription elongation factor S-II
VIKWKKNIDATKEAKKNPRGGSLGSGSASGSGTAGSSSGAAGRGTASPAPSSYSKTYEGDPDKRHFKTDKVDINRTGNTTRDNSIGIIYNGLAFRSTASIESVLSRAVEVEEAAHRAYKGPETTAYRTKLRALFTALKRKDNRELGRRVMSGDIEVKKFVLMSDADLASAEQRARDEAMEKDNMNNAQVPMPEKQFSAAFKCGKCGQHKVAYTQAQTRSADEPMTTFCECVNCGNRWKVSCTRYFCPRRLALLVHLQVFY